MTTLHPFGVAEAAPDSTAIVMGSGERLTYGELASLVRRLQHLLHERGLRRGSTIAIFSTNTIEFLPIAWAAQSSGMYYTTVNSHLTAAEAAYIVDDCGAEVLFASEDVADVAAELTGDLVPNVSTRIMTGKAIDGWEDFDDLVAGMPDDPFADSCEGDFFLYSSGTTGRPKGVRRALPLKALGEGAAHLPSFQTMFGITADGVYLSPAPLYHAAPIASTMVVHRLGATVVVMEKFDPERALQLIEEHGVTSSQMVPTMFVRLLKLPDEVRARYDVSSLQKIVHAAAPCPQAVKHQMIEWLGPIIDEYYAASEGTGSTHITAADWLEHPGSVGKPIVGIPHILGPDGEELPADEPGAIWFEGTTPFEYHGNPEATAETRNERGWGSVGDVGYLDEDGYLYLSDRKAFMIISGGVNIYPQEIENALVTHPKVMDVAVLGVPNDEFGEEVKAVVQPVDWADAGPELATELLAHCREHLAGYKCPRSVDFEEQLPRLDSGKLYKRLLRDRYWGDRTLTS